MFLITGAVATAATTAGLAAGVGAGLALAVAYHGATAMRDRMGGGMRK
ncbi:MAG: hypothetical protein ACFBWO_08370 [Paracoccaceae bacterium]